MLELFACLFTLLTACAIYFPSSEPGHLFLVSKAGTHRNILTCLVVMSLILLPFVNFRWSRNVFKQYILILLSNVYIRPLVSQILSSIEAHLYYNNQLKSIRSSSKWVSCMYFKSKFNSQIMVSNSKCWLQYRMIINAVVTVGWSVYYNDNFLFFINSCTRYRFFFTRF